MRRVEIDENWIREAYLIERLSLTEIAKKVGASHQTISRRLKALGIQIRPGYEVNRGKPRKAEVSKEWLYDQYVVKGKTTREIARELGCSKRLVADRLRRFDIPPRRAGLRKGSKMDPEVGQKISRKLKGRKVGEETRRKLSQRQNTRPSGWNVHTEEIAAKRILGLKRYWNNVPPEERRERVLRAVIASRRANPSSIEIAIEKVLLAIGEPYESQKRIGRYVVDFFLPKRNLIIECDGRYWHSLPGKREHDKRRDAELRNLGYRVLRLTEEQIRENPEQALISGLKLVRGGE